MVHLGPFELHVVSDGFFRLDGGAMFGVVPKTLWEKTATPDERNRVVLGLNLLLIRTGRKNILVDTGIGGKHDAKFVDLYAVDRSTTALDGLRALGLGPGDIDVVVLTHLHFDHAGGATARHGSEAVPVFTKAAHILQEGMWEEALGRNPRTRGSYAPEDFVPLRAAGLLKIVRGDEEIVPGVSVRRTGGHVEHHQMVVVEGGGRKAVYWGDILPSTAHVKPAWVTGYDLFPAEAAAIKERLSEEAVKEEWLNVFDHDPYVSMGYLRREEKGFRVETVERAGGRR